MENLMWIDIAIWVVYGLLGLATIGALGAGVISLILSIIGGGIGMAGGFVNFLKEELLKSKGAVIGMCGLIAVVGIAFFLSTGGNVSEALLERTNTSEMLVRPVGAGLISFYILFGCAFLLLIGTEIWRPFKK